MDWNTFLTKRAKHDLELCSDLNSIIQSDKHVYIVVKEGKCTVEAPYKFFSWRERTFKPRKDFIEKFMTQIDFSDSPDCKIPLRVSDSYEYTCKLSFSWAKPANKPGLLFPCWSFTNWEDTVKEFDTHYVEWDKRYDEGYFKGQDSSCTTTNLRKIVQDIFPSFIDLDSKVISPITDMQKYKVAFDLPGYAPWSVRTPFINLSGCASLRILLYDTKRNEEPWIQFFEHDIHGIFIEESTAEHIPEKRKLKLAYEMNTEFNKSLGKRAQYKAEKLRQSMRSLTTKHMLTYVQYICNFVGEKQDI